MRHFFMSGLIVLASVTMASASDRYPSQKRYVNQTGQIVTVGQTIQPIAYAPVRQARALPPVQIVPVAVAPVIAQPAPRVRVAQAPRTVARNGLFGSINVDPEDWPSGRTCCRPGQPYFNENPDS